MLLDKLWLRIKGELLLLKDDMAAGDDLRVKAETLLEKLERILGAPESKDERDADRTHRVEGVHKKAEEAGGTADRQNLAQGEAAPTLAELEKAWEELSRLRQEKKEGATDQAPPRPNPRKLG